MKLLAPSVLGAVFYSFVAAMVLVMNQFNFIRHYLQMPDSVHFSGIFLGWFDQAVNHLLGRTNTQVVVVGLFWALVGLAVYFFLWGLARFMSDVSEGLEERRYFLWPQGSSPNRAVMEALSRGAFRFGALVCLAIVMLAVLPRELHRAGGAADWAAYAVWFIGLWLTLHLMAVLIRLIMLKPRIFG